MLTLEAFAQWVAQQLEQSDLYYGHGTDNAWDEALAIITAVCDLPPDCPREYASLELTKAQRDKIKDLLQQRIEQRIPVPYLTRRAYFMGLPFYVDERVIIPRSPLAELIQQGLELWIKPENVNKICDLCTGSACIAIAMALQYPQAQVDAVDISEPALEVANRNVNEYQLTERVHLHQSDLFAQLDQKRYDLIISNPPYVDARDMAKRPAEFCHEPDLALAAGQDGLEIVERILRDAADHLTEHGVLIVEVGNSQAALMKKYPHAPFVWLDFEAGGEGVFMITAQDLLSLHTALR